MPEGRNFGLYRNESAAQRAQLDIPEFKRAVVDLSLELTFPNPDKKISQSVKDVLFSGNAIAIDMATRTADDVLDTFAQVNQAMDAAIKKIN